jgi:DNA-binding MarR family transcriptional regulator
MSTATKARSTTRTTARSPARTTKAAAPAAAPGRKRAARSAQAARPEAAAEAGAHDAAAAHVLRQFRQVFNAVKTHFQQVERNTGLGGAQMWALSVVQARPTLSVTELAQEMDIHQSTASNLVKGLVERGLVLSEREGADRRVTRLRVLPPGARVLRGARGPFAGVLPGALRQLDAATLKRLQQDLTKLIGVLGVDKRAGRIPLSDL